MLWLLIATHPTETVGQLQLVVLLLPFESVLKLHSQSASFVHELSAVFKYNLQDPRFGHPCYILSMVLG